MPLYNAWLKNQAFAPLPPPNPVSNQPILPIINNPFCSTIPIVNLPSGSQNLVNQPNGYISNQVDGHKIKISTNGYNAPILTNVPDQKKIPYENFYSHTNLKADPEIANLLPNVPFTYLQADDEMRFKTMQSFQSCIGLDGGKYTIRTPFGTKKIPYKKELLTPFRSYLETNFINSMGSHLQDPQQMDLMVEFKTKLYSSNEIGSIKSKLEKNLQYLQFRFEGKFGTTLIPAFCIYYEIYQMLDITKDSINNSVIPQNYQNYKIDILLYLWVFVIFKDTGNFTKGDVSSDLVQYKTYSIKNTKQDVPVDYSTKAAVITSNYYGNGASGSFW